MNSMKPHIKYVGTGSWLCTEYSFIRAVRLGFGSVSPRILAYGDTPAQAYRRYMARAHGAPSAEETAR